MGVRTRIADGLTRAAKAFGGPAPEAMRQAAGQTSQMDMAHPFAPGEPIGPYDGYSRHPRTQNFATGTNIATRPRTHERVSFETLHGLITNYDIADICIWHRIDSIRSLDWQLIAAEHYSGDVTDAIPVGLAALKKPDRQHSFGTWLGKWMYDVLAYDAGSLYRLRNRAGRCIGLLPVDGKTVAPLLDYWGMSPEPPAEAYVQYVNGLPWNWLTRDDLIYEPYRPHNDSPYGHAPIESIILNANTDIRFQVYFLQRFTEGNLPAAFAAAPETWSAQQIEQFQEYWDTAMYGDQSRKHQIRWMPGGTSFAWSDEKEFTDTFSLFLMRKTCAAFHVVPSDIGFTENVNRSSGESQADVQHRVGDLPLLGYAEGIISGFLQDDLGLPLQMVFDKGEEQVDRVAQAQADKIYIDLAVIGASEVREMRYGRPEPDGMTVPRFINSSRGGPIPLAALMAVAGPVDPATGAPLPGAPLPHKVFGGVEGVLPVPPIRVMSLAEQEFGAGAMPPAPPPQPKMTAADVTPQLALPAAPVAKDGAPAAPAGPAAGITSETGLYSYDLAGRDDDEDEDAPQTAGHVTVAVDPQRAAVAKEMAAFRRFERARRKAGAWRDFEFAAAGKVQAHRLNDAGRLAVRKAAGEVAVAGLAVLAEDTGRVLMLQRALCDDDPAAGKIEFPGGHLEEGESPLAAAWREWAEETSAVPPPGRETGSWTAGDGIYRGIVWTVESESLVPVRGGAVVPNPDDPDGDQVEAILWMDPADLAGNPAVRAELAASLDDVLAALGCSAAGSPEQGDGAICPCGVPVVYDELDGWQHADGSVSHDDGESVSDKMAAIAKAGDPGRPKDRKRREWPGWKLDGPTVAHWAPLVAEGIRRKLPPERLHRLASGYLTANPDQDGNASGKRGRNEAAGAWLAVWLAGQGVTLTPDTTAQGIVTDGWLIGGTSAAAMVTGLNADTGGWQPGDGEKARHRLEEIGVAAALAAALDSHSGDVAGYIAGGYAAELARVLAGADGTVSADVLAGVLADAIASEDVAAGLVLTQISTYTGMAAQDYYFANSVSLFQWVVDPSVKNCPVCLSNAAADPRRFGEAWPGGLPAPLQHPRCRCSLVPSGLG